MSSTMKIVNSQCTKEENNAIVNIVQKVFNDKETNADKAKYIKQAIDNQFEDHWQVIVGKNFATFVTHEEKKFCHLMANNQTAVQVFKAGY